MIENKMNPLAKGALLGAAFGWLVALGLAVATSTNSTDNLSEDCQALVELYGEYDQYILESSTYLGEIFDPYSAYNPYTIEALTDASNEMADDIDRLGTQANACEKKLNENS